MCFLMTLQFYNKSSAIGEDSKVYKKIWKSSSSIQEFVVLQWCLYYPLCNVKVFSNGTEC